MPLCRAVMRHPRSPQCSVREGQMESQDFSYQHMVVRAPLFSVRSAVWGSAARRSYGLSGAGPVQGGWRGPGLLPGPAGTRSGSLRCLWRPSGKSRLSRPVGENKPMLPLARPETTANMQHLDKVQSLVT